jgi:phosphoglycolate phosphatase
VSKALEHLGADPLDDAALRAFVGPPLEVSFAQLGFDERLVVEAVRVYRESYDLLGPPLFPGVLPALRQLREAGLRLALATSKPQVLAHEIVAHHGVLDLLDAVCGAAGDHARSTKAHVVGDALEALGHPARPVMVGDRSHDVEGAAAHGVPCVGVLWGYGDADELTSAGATALAADLDELVELLLA